MQGSTKHQTMHRLFQERLRAEGEAKGRAQDIIRLLSGRGIQVDDVVRTRLEECTDLDALNMWFDRAIAADAVDELFA